jgi:hypothetical protein
VALPFVPPPEKGYPVLYVLDGYLYFASATEATRLFNAPEVVVVGIGYPHDPEFIHSVEERRGPAGSVFSSLPPALQAAQSERVYDLTLPAGERVLAAEAFPGSRVPKEADVGGLDDFLRTIEVEVKPRIAALVHIDASNQALFGHSLGGLAVLHALFIEPNAYRSFIIASPSIWWNHRAVLADFPRFADAINSGVASPRVLITVGAEESTPPKAIPKSWGALDLGAVQANLQHARLVQNGAALVTKLKALHGMKDFLVADYAVFDHQFHTISPWPALGRAIPFAFPATP